MDYKKQATEKFLELRNGLVDDTETLEDYLAFCYLKYRPNEYGKKIQKRLENYFGMHKVSESTEKGDSFFSTTSNRKMWFEIKVSYLGINNTYSIRYIRPWQEFDYYLLCFINPMDCKPKFFVTTCQDLMDNFSYNYMNGTIESNKSNSKSAYGITIRNDGESYRTLKSLNRLEGNDPINVFEFLARQNLRNT
jgi:hypothetical protein